MGKHYLKRLRRFAAIEIQDKPDDPTVARATKELPRFIISDDMPGELSEHGPRPNNDHTDFKQIDIMPTRQEIQSERNEYLPSDHPDDWHIPGLPGLLDRQFRLLREDTVGQLRDAAKQELDRLCNPELEDDSKKQSTKARSTRSYRNVNLKDVVLDATKGLIFVLGFDHQS